MTFWKEGGLNLYILLKKILFFCFFYKFHCIRNLKHAKDTLFHVLFIKKSYISVNCKLYFEYDDMGIKAVNVITWNLSNLESSFQEIYAPIYEG